jgi:Sortase domain
MKRTTNRVAVAVLALAGALLVGCSSSTSAPAGQDGTSIAAQQQTDAAPLPGFAVTVPALQLTNAPLVPLGLNPDRTIQVPPLSQARELGVYDKGPMPGAPGPSVILGHVNSGGVDGAFAHLDALKAGDEVDTTQPGGAVTKFTVYRTQTAEKSNFPTKSVYSDTIGPELRLITCGGQLDQTAHNYLGQVVVYAKKA